MTETPTVFIVDDDESVRDSVAALLAAGGYRCAGFESGEAFLAADLGARPACAVVDMRLPGMDGLALQRALAARGLALPVIFMTGFGDVPLAVAAMKAGAVDFVEKPCPPETLRQAVDRALAGEGAAAPAPDPGASAAARARVARLSPREREVLAWLVAGAPNKVIAHRLGISPRTVEIHRARVMEKLEARSLSVAVRLALAAGVGPAAAGD